MAEIDAASTELEAVNAILATVGEAPVNTIDDSFVDAQLAHTLLLQESRRVQNLSWTWNTDLEVFFPIDLSGHIPVGNDTLRFIYAADPNVIVRGEKLYDRSRQSYVFTAGITAEAVVRLLTWEELPEAARAFITTRAGRRFQNRYGGDVNEGRILQSDETAAWAALQNFEAEIAHFNVLSSSALVQRIKGFRA